MKLRRKIIESLSRLLEQDKDEYNVDFTYSKDGDEKKLMRDVMKEQRETIKEYEFIFDIYNKRKYRKKYLKDRKKEEGHYITPDSDEVYERYYKQKEEIAKLKRQIEIKDNYLDLIYCIGYDYDGYEKAESLKELIDELVDYAIRGKNNDDKTVMFEGSKNSKFNILHERIE